MQKTRPQIEESFRPPTDSILKRRIPYGVARQVVEQAGVNVEICNMTFGKDRRTNDLALAILHEEVEHETWFSEYLQEDPSGRFRRGSPGTSPFVRRFMSADIG